MTTGKLSQSLTTQLTVGRHQFISGVSEEQGGHDEGPGPHGLLEASLVSCTILTVQMYAKRKAWPLTDIEVSVNIEVENKEGTQIRRDIKLMGNLTEEQKERLLQIANKCPIHKLLSGNIRIETYVI